MGISFGAVAITLALSIGQVTSDIGQEERDFQSHVFQQWWGGEIVWKFDQLPTEGKVTEDRVPYSGYIYPDTAGGTMSVLRKYDQAFHGGQLLATEYERKDTSSRETVMRPNTYTQRFGLFGAQVRTFTVMESVNATPAWYGHCNGWTSAAIRHAEPRQSVTRNGVVFTPADIKGLLAEIYMYNDPQMLAGDGTPINAGVFHLILANWIGRGSHPLGMETDPGKEKWNYPVYEYATQSSRWSPQQVEVAMKITSANSSQGEFEQSPRIPRTRYFHYLLQLDADGSIVGGNYFRDSSRIDMLWVPLRPKPCGAKGHERGNPHMDVEEVLSIWRESVPDELRKNWVVIDPFNRNPVITVANACKVPERRKRVLQVTAKDDDMEEALAFVAPQQLAFSLSGGADAELFVIDAKTGRLRFAIAPDFELPADGDEDNVYEVEIKVEDGAGGSAVQSLGVTVTNINDAPVITSDTATTVAENQVAALTVTREDQDRPAQRLACSLTGGADRGRFAIDAETGNLNFKTAPDFELPADADKDNVYEVEVTVEDGAKAKAAQSVRVSVTDANDTPMIVSSESTNASENQLAAFTLAAHDQDSPAQTLQFSLCGGDDLLNFAIDSHTGELTFTDEPDFENPVDVDKDNVYEVEVKVADGVGGTVTQRVRVCVTDANDAPAITSTDGPKAAENQLPVLTLTCTDPDLPRQRLFCSLTGGADCDAFTIDAATGDLRFRQAPDFEQPADANQDNVYEVEVKVDDGAGGTAVQLVRVTVTDVKERPVIGFATKVRENETEVLTVIASDEGMSMQGLTISLSGGADRMLFSIDAKTGDLSFQAAPDFENPSDADKDNIYEVEVKVTDDGGGSAMQSISVRVIDTTEEPPAVDAN